MSDFQRSVTIPLDEYEKLRDAFKDPDRLKYRDMLLDISKYFHRPRHSDETKWADIKAFKQTLKMSEEDMHKFLTKWFIE